MVKSRRAIYETNLSIKQQQILSIYLSRNINRSLRQTDDQSNITSPTTDLRTLSIKQQPKKEKRITEGVLDKATSFIQKSKTITKGLLCEYKISVTTGNCNGTSTNGPIRIKLCGTNGHTNFHEFIQSETHVPFSKEQTDLFTIQTYHVGELIGVTIGHDRKDMEHRDNNESQSNYSTTRTAGTETSNTTNSTGSDDTQIKKQRKQQHVSVGPTTVAKKPLSLSTNTNTLSRSSPTISTTIEAYFNREEFQPPSASTHQIRSPIITTSSSSDSEIEGDITNQTGSTTPTPSPTSNQIRLQSVSEHDTLQTKSTNDIFKRHSIDHGRLPARLEKPNSPLSISPERLNKTNEHNIFSFFE